LPLKYSSTPESRFRFIGRHMSDHREWQMKKQLAHREQEFGVYTYRRHRLAAENIEPALGSRRWKDERGPAPRLLSDRKCSRAGYVGQQSGNRDYDPVFLEAASESVH
jgi:hypothetical protein